MNEHATAIEQLQRQATATPDDLPVQLELLEQRRALKLRPAVIESLEAVVAIAPERLGDRLQLARFKDLRGHGGESGRAFDDCVGRLDDCPRFDNGLVRDLLMAAHLGPDPSENAARLDRLAVALGDFRPRSSDEAAKHVLGQARVELARRRRDDFLAAIDEIDPDGPKDHIRRRLLQVADRWRDPRFPEALPPKVFVIGLSRTGTSSMDDALRICGLLSVHWFNPLTGALPDELDVQLFDALGDINISADFEALAAAYPGARFIWTRRPIDPWLRSIRDHYANGKGVEHPSELLDPDHLGVFGGQMGHIHRSLYAHHDSWADAFRAYEQRVETFFADQPSERLLRVDVTSGIGWDPIIRFLNVRHPTAPFPHSNASPRHDLDRD